MAYLEILIILTVRIFILVEKMAPSSWAKPAFATMLPATMALAFGITRESLTIGQITLVSIPIVAIIFWQNVPYMKARITKIVTSTPFSDLVLQIRMSALTSTH